MVSSTVNTAENGGFDTFDLALDLLIEPDLTRRR